MSGAQTFILREEARTSGAQMFTHHGEGSNAWRAGVRRSAGKGEWFGETVNVCAAGATWTRNAAVPAAEQGASSLRAGGGTPPAQPAGTPALRTTEFR